MMNTYLLGKPMSIIAFFLGVFTLVNCMSTTPLLTERTYYSNYGVVQIEMISHTQTFDINELRIFDPRSALDAAVLLYDMTGKWNQLSIGKYQTNINQYVWKDIFINDTIKNLTVITDGTETLTDYYTSFIVIDDKNQDALNLSHKDRAVIADYLVNALRTLPMEKRQYAAIRQQRD